MQNCSEFLMFTVAEFRWPSSVCLGVQVLRLHRCARSETRSWRIHGVCPNRFDRHCFEAKRKLACLGLKHKEILRISPKKSLFGLTVLSIRGFVILKPI